MPSSPPLDCTCILVMLRMRNITHLGEVFSFPSPNLVLLFSCRPQEHSTLSASERARALWAYCSFLLRTFR